MMGSRFCAVSWTIRIGFESDDDPVNDPSQTSVLISGGPLCKPEEKESDVEGEEEKEREEGRETRCGFSR